MGGRGAGGGGKAGGGGGGGGGAAEAKAGTGVVTSKADALARFNTKSYSKNATDVKVTKNKAGEWQVRWTNKRTGLNHRGTYTDYTKKKGVFTYF